MAPVHGTIPSAKDRPRVVQTRRHASVAVHDHDDDVEEEDVAPGFLQVCWPAVFGILLAVIAPKIHAYVVNQWGDTGERLVFPFMLLSGRPEFGFSQDFTNGLPELVMYLTFPFFGLYASWSMSRRTRFGAAMVQVIFVNLIAAFVLWLLSKPGATHGL